MVMPGQVIKPPAGHASVQTTPFGKHTGQAEGHIGTPRKLEIAQNLGDLEIQLIEKLGSQRKEKTIPDLTSVVQPTTAFPSVVQAPVPTGQVMPYLQPQAVPHYPTGVPLVPLQVPGGIFIPTMPPQAQVYSNYGYMGMPGIPPMHAPRQYPVRMIGSLPASQPIVQGPMAVSAAPTGNTTAPASSQASSVATSTSGPSTPAESMLSNLDTVNEGTQTSTTKNNADSNTSISPPEGVSCQSSVEHDISTESDVVTIIENQNADKANEVENIGDKQEKTVKFEDTSSEVENSGDEKENKPKAKKKFSRFLVKRVADDPVKEKDKTKPGESLKSLKIGAKKKAPVKKKGRFQVTKVVEARHSSFHSDSDQASTAADKDSVTASPTSLVCPDSAFTEQSESSVYSKPPLPPSVTKDLTRDGVNTQPVTGEGYYPGSHTLGSSEVLDNVSTNDINSVAIQIEPPTPQITNLHPDWLYCNNTNKSNWELRCIQPVSDTNQVCANRTADSPIQNNCNCSVCNSASCLQDRRLSALKLGKEDDQRERSSSFSKIIQQQVQEQNTLHSENKRLRKTSVPAVYKFGNPEESVKMIDMVMVKTVDSGCKEGGCLHVSHPTNIQDMERKQLLNVRITEGR